MKERQIHFDILKGFAILLVILGHIFYMSDHTPYTESVLWTFLCSIHMPLFAFISGYFSSRKLDLSPQGIWRYWQRKAKRLLLPLLFMPVLMSCLEHGFSLSLPWSEYLGRYWFTYVLFEVFVFFYVLRCFYGFLERKIELLRDNLLIESIYWFSSIALLFFLVRLPKFTAGDFSMPELMNPYRIDFLYKYFIMGYLVAKYNALDRILKSHRFAPFVLLAYFILLYVEQSTKTTCFGGIPLTILGIASFYYLAFQMAKEHNRINKSLSYLGQISLPIYLTHYFFLPNFPWLNHFLIDLVSDKHKLIFWEFWIGTSGVVMTLIPTLILIYIVGMNPYLSIAVFGEKLPTTPKVKRSCATESKRIDNNKRQDNRL